MKWQTKTAKNSKPVEVPRAFAPVAFPLAGDRQGTAGQLMSSFGLNVNRKMFGMYARGRFVAKVHRSAWRSCDRPSAQEPRFRHP